MLPSIAESHPLRVRELKHVLGVEVAAAKLSHPLRVRELKPKSRLLGNQLLDVAPFTGA